MFDHFNKNTKHLTTIVVALIGAAIVGISGTYIYTHSTDAYATNTTTVAKHSSQISDDQRLTPHTIARMKYVAPVKPVTKKESTTESHAQAVQAPAAAASTTAQSQASSTSSTTTSTAAASQPVATTSTNDTAKPTPAPQQRTDGFNLNGSHFDLVNYADMTGAEVPRWTQNIYRYVVLPNYYLAEGDSRAGVVARGAGIGSTLILNGETLRMTAVISVNRNDPNAFESMRQIGSQNKAVLQTCYDASGVNLKVELFN